MDRPLDRVERQRAEALFEEALEVPEGDRADFVGERCGEDERLAAGVMRLLGAHRRLDGVLDGEGPGRTMRSEAREVRYGPYRVLHSLGSGGMGEVYLAVREDAFMRRVALKVVRGRAGDTSAVRRFEVERQIMASLSHPNVAQLLDGGVTAEGVPYLAMEYVEGLPLTTFCDRERLTVPERLELFRKVCDAVHHAHRNLVIHRDLKPSNILVTGGRQPKLLDFGIAKLQQAASTTLAQPVTHPDLRALTPDYASPEQMRGEPLTTASDVFSLGVVLYELLTGLHPFRDAAGSPAGLVAAICEREPPPPSAAVTASAGAGKAGAERRASVRGSSVTGLRTRLRRDLDNIVMKALRKESGRRYASVEQLSSDVGRYLSAEPVLACGDGRGYRLRKFIQRRRLDAFALGAVLVSLIFGSSIALWQARVAGWERDRATRALERAEASSAFLLGLFESDDARQTLADSVSARTMLERGLQEVDALDAYPELRARLLTVLGRAQWNLGAYARAAALFRSAVAELEAHGDPARNPDVAGEAARTLSELANVLKMTGEYSEALSTAQRAHDLRVRHGDPDVAASLMQLGTIRVYLGDLQAADSLTRSALDLRRGDLGPRHPKVTDAMEALAAISARRGDVDEAEGLLREVVARRRDEDGPEATSHAVSLLNLARLLTEHRGSYEEAEALYRRALPIVDSEGPERATTLAELAETVARRERWDEATSLYREAIELRRALFSPDHASVADLLWGMGRVLMRSGRLDEAEGAFEESLRIWELRMGPEHPATAYGLAGLARVAMARGDLGRAEVLARQALAIRRGALARGHTLIAASEALLGEVLGMAGQPEVAEELLRSALDTFRAAMGDDHREVRAVEETLRNLRASARLHETDETPTRRPDTAP